jgi:hypothetical protein
MKRQLLFIALKCLRHATTQYRVAGDEWHVVFDARNAGSDLREAIDILNARRMRIPWPGNRVLQFGIAGEGRWAVDDGERQMAEETSEVK